MTRLWPDGDPIQVILSADGLPTRFSWQGTWREVVVVTNRWRVQASWWDPDANARREYITATTADGLLCTLYRDLHTGAWFWARLYD